MEPLEAALATLAAADPLTGPGVNGWDVTIRWAAQLSTRPAAWVEALLPVDLALADRAGCRWGPSGRPPPAAKPGTPWGDADPEPGRLNADPTQLRRTNPVVVFPAGDSPNGLVDLAGNIAEWTVSVHTEAPDASALFGTAPDRLARRVVHAGAWGLTTDNCRAAYRNRDTPAVRSINLGF